MKHAARVRRTHPLALALLAGLPAVALAQPAAPQPAGDQAAQPGDTKPAGALLRYPDVSATDIVFSYANDLWTVPKSGGRAQRLASPPGQETFPRFSPKGDEIAFIGNYEGNRDIYTIPFDGGIPFRVTYHPGGEVLSDWTSDGKLLYYTNGLQGLARTTRIFTTSPTGGLPTALPMPYGAFASLSPDGATIAYTPHTIDTRTWKRYRGGMATDIWLFNLKNNTSKKITDWEGIDSLPMWSPDGATIYYLSDDGEGHRTNIWAYTVASGQRRRVTNFTADDVRWPSIGPATKDAPRGEIVFQLGTGLHLLDLATEKTRAVNVVIPGDRPTIRRRQIDAARFVESGGISPTGKRVVLEARGDLWSMPAKEGAARNLTRTDGTFERSPAWSPDGRWLAYFSDESGEYELWVRPSDARAPEKKDEKKDDQKSDKPADKPDAPAAPADGKADAKPTDEASQADAADAKSSRAPRQLTNLGPGFRYNPTWSPDSKHIAICDQGGRMYLVSVADGSTKLLDTDPWSNQTGFSWSSDSHWLAYQRADDHTQNEVIWVYNVQTGEKKALTSPMFATISPAFDRKGEWLYAASSRSINSPEYSSLDTSFIYSNTHVLMAFPLRTDVKSPLLPRSDEETYKEDKKDDAKPADQAKAEKSKDKDNDKSDSAGKSDKSDDAAKSKTDKPDATPADALTGRWQGTATGGEGSNIPPGGVMFTMDLKLDGDKVTGTLTSVVGSGPLTGSFDAATGTLTVTMPIPDGVAEIQGKVTGDNAAGTWKHGAAQGQWTATRSAVAGAAEPAKSDDPAGGKPDAKADKKDEPLKIETDGIEARSILLPVAPGVFDNLAVNDSGKLLYVRRGARGSGDSSGIKILDLADDSPSEKDVAPGGGFELSADGKKLLTMGGNPRIIDASAGGKSQSVSTSGMTTLINPRHEWRQILHDTYRLHRDFFYEPTMHGVDWEGVYKHYDAMLDDVYSREDLSYVMGEMVSELNIGHAYVQGGDNESQPIVGVGMLGCDYELVQDGDHTAYKISRIYTGGPWDADARGPLSQPGVDVKQGDFLLAVDGIPLDTTRDPWAAFQGRAERPLYITVNTVPYLDGKEREVLVKPIGSEADLRYRAWIERNRQYVAEKTNGTVGYIYVPNTGVDGQSDLVRQFVGQRALPGLIIDERWNGGGQIPTRFIELLNRPVVNYWARRNGNDWTWPPDAHNGPKVMLANGLAGSGGDAFPAYFQRYGLGKVIGTRTWGGLVGISGNPGLIDGGRITVPTFGFYDKDGTWGIEGHGVDPDIEVIDDPALMVNGGDPQLDKAIEVVSEQVKTNPYTPPKRPASPNRRGMGIPDSDK